VLKKQGGHCYERGAFGGVGQLGAGAGRKIVKKPVGMKKAEQGDKGEVRSQETGVSRDFTGGNTDFMHKKGSWVRNGFRKKHRRVSLKTTPWASGRRRGCA